MNERLQCGRVSTIARTLAIKTRKKYSVVDELLRVSWVEICEVIGDSHDRSFLLLCVRKVFARSIRRQSGESANAHVEHNAGIDPSIDLYAATTTPRTMGYLRAQDRIRGIGDP